MTTTEIAEIAFGIYNNEHFKNTIGSQQVYDCEVYHKQTKFRSYEQWAWAKAHQETRLERAVAEGKAHRSCLGIIYDDVSREYHEKLLLQELEDVCPGMPIYR